MLFVKLRAKNKFKKKTKRERKKRKRYLVEPRALLRWARRTQTRQSRTPSLARPAPYYGNCVTGPLGSIPPPSQSTRFIPQSRQMDTHPAPSSLLPRPYPTPSRIPRHPYTFPQPHLHGSSEKMEARARRQTDPADCLFLIDTSGVSERGRIVCRNAFCPLVPTPTTWLAGTAWAEKLSVYIADPSVVVYVLLCT